MRLSSYGWHRFLQFSLGAISIQHALLSVENQSQMFERTLCPAPAKTSLDRSCRSCQITSQLAKQNLLGRSGGLRKWVKKEDN